MDETNRGKQMTARAAAGYVGGFVAVAVIGVLIGSLLGMYHQTRSGPEAADAFAGTGAGGATAITGQQRPLVVRGDVAGLEPGGRTTVAVQITNPNPRDLQLQRVTVVAGDASPGCRAVALSVGSYDSAERGANRYLIAGGGSTVVSLPIQLTGSATRDQDGCRDVAFPLTYEVSATGWDR